MASEYTPTGESVTFTVPDYEDAVDGPQALKDLADDVTSQFSVPGRAETLTNKTITSPTVTGGSINADSVQVSGDDAVTETATQTLTNKTLAAPTINNGIMTGTSLSAPTIGDFSNAEHDHSTAAKGGNIPQSSVTSLVSDLATKETVANVNTHIADTSTHGVTGAVVGTTDSQTLTNKTLTSPAVSDPTVSGTVTATGATVSGGTLSGQTVTGASLGSDLDATGNKVVGLGVPSAPSDAATKDYVDSTTVAAAGDSMTGDLAMGGNKVTGLASPTDAADAATKGYVDAEVAAVVDAAPGALDTLNELASALGDDASFSTTVTNSIATKVAKAGDSVTGDLTFSGGATAKGVPDPASGSDAANKTYTDTKVAKSGDTMTGDLTMSGGAKITGLPTPTVASDAAPKSYIDQVFGSTASAAQSDASAAQSAIAAATSAGQASGSAAAALASEQASATSESNSAASAAASSSSASQSSTSASNAATSASQAASSQAAASASEIASAASESAAAASAAAASSSESNAASSEALAEDWATKMVGTVDGVEYSAKYYASIANPAGQVTETGAATLTNKTMSGASNTFSDVPQSAVTSLTTDLAAKETPAGAQAKADAAQTAAQTYADGLAVNYDAAGSAAAAQSAAQSYADTAVSNLVDTAPATLDTLNELAAALGDDPNFATTVSNQIGTKADASALTAHESDTTNVHGITDTSALVVTTDSRLSDARTPTSHAASHQSGGSDELVIAQSQVTNLSSDLALKAATILIPPLVKADSDSVVFTKTGNGSASIKAGTYVNVNGTIIHFASATAITMPTLTAGTDYYVYVNTSGTAQAVEATGTWPTWFASYLNLTTYDNGIVSPPANSVLIGGFHYAPGGNGTWTPDIWSESPHNKPVRMEFDWPYIYPQAGGGGDTTPQINEYSFWDLKWRPSAPDPRGMTLVQDTFWCDIYLLNIDPAANGTSKNNVEIWGHDPNSNPSHWNIKHQLANFGKRLPSQGEFTELAMGTTCEASRGNAPVTTGLSTTNTGTENTDEKFTSRWGVIQSTGVAWVYALDVGGSRTQSQNFDYWDGPTYWSSQSQIHQRLGERPGSIIMGGRYSNGVNSGYGTVLHSGISGINGEYFTGRGVCEHRVLL